MARTEYYNQGAASVTLDGDTVTHFADGDSIRIIPNDVGSATTDGLDGASTSFSSVRSGAWEIDLKPVSPTLDLAFELMEAQRYGNGRLFNITVTTGVGEFITLRNCGMVNDGGSVSGGPVMATRTIKGTYESRKKGL